jgi:broad specificity phosphatase PhoE
MTTRFDLVCLAPTPAMRKAIFGIEDDIDDKAAEQATRQGGNLPAPERSFCSPDLAARSTARRLGHGPALPVAALRDIDFGRWHGRTLAEIQASDPQGLGDWLSDPTTAPHGGESIAQLCDRVAAWLIEATRQPGRVRVVCSGNTIRAAILHCLDVPVATFRRLDIHPLSLTRLSTHDGQWRLQGMSCDL